MPTLHLALVVFAGVVAVAVSDDHEQNLLRALMRRYDRRIRPSKNASSALNVTFGLALGQIIDVDEKNQIITTNCWLNQAWIDYKLQWNPVNYGGISVIQIPHEDIWKPDIVLYNNADVSAYRSSISTNVIVSADGNVTWLSMVIFKSSCAINVRFFPFDEQNCSLKFASWTYDGFQIDLRKVGRDGDLSNYIPNNEWQLVDMHVTRRVRYYSCCVGPYPDVTYVVQIRRRPLFYVFNMILPCLLITLVALLGFYIPSDSGEKVTMGITTLLSMTVFLMLVTESMPPTSNVLPLIGLYYGITIGIVSLATAMTVLTLNVHHKGSRGRRVPRLVKCVCFGFFAKLMCISFETDSPADVSQTSAPYCDDSRQPYIQLKKTYNYRMENNHIQDFSSGADIECGDPFIVERDKTHLSPRRYHARVRNGASASSADVTSAEACQRQMTCVLARVQRTLERHEARLSDRARRDALKLEWQQLSRVIDRVLLVVFIVVTLGVTFGIMFRAPLSANFAFGTDQTEATATAVDDDDGGGGSFETA